MKKHRNRGNKPRKQQSILPYDTDSILNDIKRGISDYFKGHLPSTLKDAHRLILVVKGHIWIPVEARFDRHQEKMDLHTIRYAYYDGELQSRTVTICTNVTDSIHDLNYFKVGGDSGLLVDGTTMTSNGGLHRTGRKVKTIGEYASTITEVIDDSDEISYFSFSRKEGVPERDARKRFHHTDISSRHYRACSWLTTFYFRFLAGAVQPADRDIITKSLLFLLYQDKTLLYHNSVAPILLQILVDLGIIGTSAALQVIKKWAASHSCSDGEFLALPSTAYLKRRAEEAAPLATLELLIDRGDSIDQIAAFLSECPALAHAPQQKGRFYAWLGLHFKYRNKLSRAKEAYELCLQCSDGNSFYGNYATILYRLGCYREAADIARKCLATEGNEEEIAYAYLRLGHIFLAMQDYAVANSYYQKGVAANRGYKTNEATGRYHIAHLACSFWKAIMECCIAGDPKFDYRKEDQYKAVAKSDTRYLAALYDYLQVLIKSEQKAGLWGAKDQGLEAKSREYFAYLAQTLNGKEGDDKDIYVWVALLDAGRIRYEWLADLITERVCGLINMLSVKNPEEDARFEITNKFKSLVFKIFDLYLNGFGNCRKALALTEFYHGVVFRFNLEAIKSADLATARRELEQLSAKMYQESAEDDTQQDDELRKTLTSVDAAVASKFDKAYQRFFGIIRDFNISLESFREYCEIIDALAAGGSGVVLAFVDDESVCGVFALQRGAIQFIHLEQMKYHETLQAFDREISRVEKDYLFEDYENDLSSIIGRLSEFCGQDIFSRLVVTPGTQVRIAAAGIFHLLPFHALELQGKRLIELVEISYTNNVSLSRPAAASNGGYLLVGNAEFIDRPLQGAEAELEAIKEHLAAASVTTLVREEATKDKLLKVLNPNNNIHIACHAQFNDAHPMTSMFNLHPVDGPSGSNVSAGELVGWDLQGCNFVYLSACDSGKGKVLTGNEVIGIPRGFFMAGARNVICTMWPVCDDYAPGIAANFYRHYFNSNAVAESFNRSVRDAIADGVPLFAWAPFKLLTIQQL